jgi:hypothetical protein
VCCAAVSSLTNTPHDDGFGIFSTRGKVGASTSRPERRLFVSGFVRSFLFLGSSSPRFLVKHDLVGGLFPFSRVVSCSVKQPERKGVLFGFQRTLSVGLFPFRQESLYPRCMSKPVTRSFVFAKQCVVKVCFCVISHVIMVVIN